MKINWTNVWGSFDSWMEGIEETKCETCAHSSFDCPEWEDQQEKIQELVNNQVKEMNVSNKNINDLRSEISQISKEKHSKHKRKLKCFWTYPFGHFWGDHRSGSSYDRTCVLCGKGSSKGTYDGEWMRDISCHARRSKQFIKWIIGLKQKMKKIKPHRPIVIHGEPLTDF